MRKYYGNRIETLEQVAAAVKAVLELPGVLTGSIASLCQVSIAEIFALVVRLWL